MYDDEDFKHELTELREINKQLTYDNNWLRKLFLDSLVGKKVNIEKHKKGYQNSQFVGGFTATVLTHNNQKVEVKDYQGNIYSFDYIYITEVLS